MKKKNNCIICDGPVLVKRKIGSASCLSLQPLAPAFKAPSLRFSFPHPSPWFEADYIKLQIQQRLLQQYLEENIIIIPCNFLFIFIFVNKSDIYTSL